MGSLAFTFIREGWRSTRYSSSRTPSGCSTVSNHSVESSDYLTTGGRGWSDPSLLSTNYPGYSFGVNDIEIDNIKVFDNFTETSSHLSPSKSSSDVPGILLERGDRSTYSIQDTTVKNSLAKYDLDSIDTTELKQLHSPQPQLHSPQPSIQQQKNMQKEETLDTEATNTQQAQSPPVNKIKPITFDSSIKIYDNVISSQGIGELFDEVWEEWEQEKKAAAAKAVNSNDKK